MVAIGRLLKAASSIESARCWATKEAAIEAAYAIDYHPETVSEWPGFGWAIAYDQVRFLTEKGYLDEWNLSTFPILVLSFANRHNTHPAIVQAIFNRFPTDAERERVCRNPSHREKASVIACAWLLTHPETDTIHWGEEAFHAIDTPAIFLQEQP